MGMYFGVTQGSHLMSRRGPEAQDPVKSSGQGISGRCVRVSRTRGRSRVLEVTSVPAVILASLLVVVTWTTVLTLAQAQNVFSNQFALHIPDGDDRAAEVAAKYGYTNLGQIGSLTHYYLFEHSRVHKRSIEFSQDHHNLLTEEPHVHWFEQQVEKKRVKRDFPYYEGTSGTGGPYYSGTHSFLHPTSSYNGFVDPLYKEQWYLTGGSKDGFDMNVQTAWKRGYSGKGVTVSILDDGIQTNHPDLVLNYDPRASTDINDNDNDPTPQDNGDNKHGTRCAGEVAATAGNNICGVGVAYNASIGGVRMLDGTVNDAVEAKALGLNPDHVDIYSASWGPEDDGKTVDGPGPLARRAFIYGVTNGRRGLGSIFIWASGNGGRHVDSCNCDGYTNSIFTLSISSATQGGYKPWYLEECASTLATTYSSGTPTLDKSVATVDMDGRLRPDHICTVEHTGTSASAPLAAGIAALALEANRNLSWRDLQHLVVMTSRAGPLEKEEGWYINGVQRKFSHKFGYGLMDAGAMVDLAVNWAGVPPQHICKSREIREDREIPGSHLGKVKVFMDVDGCASSNSEIRFLEHVQCKISLRFFPRGNLRILLTSPMGTTSVLLFERPRDVASSNFDDWPFLSVHFWGEQAHGRWTLEIINSGSRRINQPGILKKWQLILYGTDINPVRVRSRSIPLHHQTGQHSAYEPPASQTQPQYRHIQPQHRYHVPSEYLYPGASETVPQVHKTTSVRAQCQHDYWVPDLAICVNACPEGYFAEDDFQKECHSCSSRCKSCYNNTSCTACEHNLVLYDTSCLPICPEGFFEADSSCERCPMSTCAACAGAMGSECVRCKEGRVLHQNTCLPQCPGGFRPTQFNECMACPTGCHSCDEHQCFKCSNDLQLSEDATYCTKATQECPVGLFLDVETRVCVGCGSDECLQCNGPNVCTECKDGFFLHEGDCIATCWDGLYHSFSHKECFACPKLCNKCSSSEECHECRPDGMLQDGKCLPHCTDGFYNDLGVCGQCSAGCKTCIGKGDDECVACNPGYNYSRGGICSPSSGVFKDPQISGSREVSCLDGYWLSPIENTCLPCHRSCSRCSGGNPYNCRSCVSPLRLDRGSSRCIECCQNVEDQDCCHCDDKRNTQDEETPYTRGYHGECHFVSRRVSESVERQISSGKWSDSAVLSFFWLSVFFIIIITIVTIQRRRQRRSSNLLSSVDEEFESHKHVHIRSGSRKSAQVRNGKGNYKSLYTPVSLSPCDDEEEAEFLNSVENESEDDSQFNSEDEAESIRRAEGAPLVLKT